MASLSASSSGFVGTRLTLARFGRAALVGGVTVGLAGGRGGVRCTGTCAGAGGCSAAGLLTRLILAKLGRFGAGGVTGGGVGAAGATGASGWGKGLVTFGFDAVGFLLQVHVPTQNMQSKLLPRATPNTSNQ